MATLRQWFACGVLLWSASGCSAASQAGPSASQGATESVSPGQQCLADARAERNPAPDAPRRIRVSQILVRHSALKEAQGTTRTPEAACLRALAALKALQQGATWEAAVQEFSDSKSSELGSITRDDVRPAFGAAAFELEVNQLSYVVETDRGFHVIVRTE